MTKLRLAMVVALAIGLRWQQIGQLSLNHFDEGVFVSGAFGVWLHGLWHFPLAQPLQAPPLFPWMVAGTFALTQTPWPMMGIYLSAALGSITVVLYFALLRRAYGDTLALVGAGLLAASDLHVAFSRMALTDVPLTFWFVAGAYAVVRLVESARPTAAVESHRAMGPVVRWAIAFGLTAGAAWNTKYNGWMIVAIAATAWLIVWARQWLVSNKRAGGAAGDCALAQFSVLLAIGLSALLAVICFAPWYLHVERTYPGGYRAVTENHLQYVGAIADWPSRAARLWRSLSAFRHYGWLATLLALAAAAAWFSSRCFISNKRQPVRAVLPTATLLVIVAALSAVVVVGSDAVILVIAAAAIVPALVFGRWTEVLFAVWAGAFLVLTPFYHPYTRLLVPGLPAMIALVVWLVSTALRQNGYEARAKNGDDATSSALGAGVLISAGPTADTAAYVVLALACTGICAVAFAWHPFGWLPSERAWDRWSSRQSYRALGDAILNATVPADAVVLCQGSPAMTLYVEREWAPLERLPFDLWVPRIDRHRECYLAVDYWGLFGGNHELARRAFHDKIDCLEAITTVPNDANLATLLDYLTVEEVAQHLSQPWPPKKMDVGDRKVVVPASLDEPYADLIVLYKIDRKRLELLDKGHEAALK